MLNYADNAMMAKAKALYGKRLKAADYDRLLQSKSVAEVAAYLKNETAYASTLGEVKEDLVHRGQLETLVRRRNFNAYVSLIHYSSSDNLFLTLYAKEQEVQQLLLVIRYLNARSMDRYLIAMPAYLARYLSFDLFALAKIRNFDELLDVLSHSGYFGVIARFRPVSADQPVDIINCERALWQYHYESILAIVNKDFRGEAREDLLTMIRNQIDYRNLADAYRLKAFFHYTPDQIQDAMVSIKTGINTARAYDSILGAHDQREADEALRGSYLARKFRLNWDGGQQILSIQLNRSRTHASRLSFRFSTNPMIIVINFMFLLEIEVSNIINIIEGIRYQIPPEEIRKLLVL